MVRWAAIRQRIGHRGAFLLAMGAYDLFYGWYLAAGYPSRATPLLGEFSWGVIWLTVGVLLTGGAFTHRDAPFFTAAIGVKTVWALEYFRLDWVLHQAGDWLRGCYWLALAAAILVVAWWPEPTPVISPEPTAEQVVQQARDT